VDDGDTAGDKSVSVVEVGDCAGVGVGVGDGGDVGVGVGVGGDVACSTPPPPLTESGAGICGATPPSLPRRGDC